MKLVGQIPRPLLGHMASRRGRSALGDEAWDNSSLAFFLSCSQAAEEIRDPGSNLQSASTHFSHLSLLSSFVVRSLFPYEEFSILFHIPVLLYFHTLTLTFPCELGILFERGQESPHKAFELFCQATWVLSEKVPI